MFGKQETFKNMCEISSLSVISVPIHFQSQPKFDVKKPMSIPPAASHTLKPASIVKPPPQPIAFQKKPSDSGLNTGKQDETYWFMFFVLKKVVYMPTTEIIFQGRGAIICLN